MSPRPAAFDYRVSLDDLRSSSKDRQNHAFESFLEATEVPVPWAGEVWEELVRLLSEGDNRQRSIASQILCNLAKSDPGRIVDDLEALLAITKDERFVTARHCLQSLWKIGITGERQRLAVVNGLARRFTECGPEENCTLIRYDILAVLRRIYNASADEQIRSTAAGLMELEADGKYRKKYATLWRT